MKFLSYLKISLLLSLCLMVFAVQAKSEDIAKTYALESFGYGMETVINQSLDPLKSVTHFNDDQKLAYFKHLKAHYYHILTPITVDAVKRTFTESEMKKLLENPYLEEEEPFASKRKKAALLIGENTTNKADEIQRMVSMVSAHHLCLKKNIKCPKTPYSEYPPEYK